MSIVDEIGFLNSSDLFNILYIQDIIAAEKYLYGIIHR